MRHEQVRSEADQTADGVGSMLQDRAVDVGRTHVVEAGEAKRSIGETEGLGALPGAQQIIAQDVATGNRRELNIPSFGIEAAGQRIDQADRPGDLGRIGLLLQAAPGHIGDGSCLPEHLSGCHDLTGFDPGHLLDHIGAIVGAQFSHALENGPALHRSPGGLDLEAAGQREVTHVHRVAALARDVGDWCFLRFVPCQVVFARSRGIDILLAKQLAVVIANQHRPIGPVAHKIPVVPPAFDHGVCDAEGEGAVAARSHLQPLVGFTCQSGEAGVYDDQSRAALLGRDGGRGVCDARHRRVVAPEKDTARVVQIRHAVGGQSRAIGVEIGEGTGPSRRAPWRWTDWESRMPGADDTPSPQRLTVPTWRERHC